MNYDYVMMGWFHSSVGRDSKLGLEIDRRERKKQRMKRPVRDAHRWEKVLSDGQNQMRPETKLNRSRRWRPVRASGFLLGRRSEPPMATDDSLVRTVVMQLWRMMIGGWKGERTGRWC
jgi:hypothetical protein